MSFARLPTGPLVTLRNGGSELVVAPECGARLVAFRVDGRDSPWDYPYVCVEPVTDANDGFNRAALDVPSHGVVVLEPGRRLAGTVTIVAGHGANEGRPYR